MPCERDPFAPPRFLFRLLQAQPISLRGWSDHRSPERPWPLVRCLRWLVRWCASSRIWEFVSTRIWEFVGNFFPTLGDGELRAQKSPLVRALSLHDRIARSSQPLLLTAYRVDLFGIFLAPPRLQNGGSPSWGTLPNSGRMLPTHVELHLLGGLFRVCLFFGATEEIKFRSLRFR